MQHTLRLIVISALISFLLAMGISGTSSFGQVIEFLPFVFALLLIVSLLDPPQQLYPPPPFGAWSHFLYWRAPKLLHKYQPVQRGSVECYRCKGRGEKLCRECYGKGKVQSGRKQADMLTGEVRIDMIPCPDCQGAGRLSCWHCKGYKMLPCPACQGRGCSVCTPEQHKAVKVMMQNTHRFDRHTLHYTDSHGTVWQIALKNNRWLIQNTEQPTLEKCYEYILRSLDS